MAAALDRHVDATSCKRVEIQAYWLSENEKPFGSENLSQYYFLAALILHESVKKLRRIDNSLAWIFDDVKGNKH